MIDPWVLFWGTIMGIILALACWGVVSLYLVWRWKV